MTLILPVDNVDKGVASMLLLKNQHKFYGVSPFYFAYMPHGTQYLFRDILEREIPSLVEPFIDSLVEIESVYQKYYTGTVPTNLSEEDKKIVYDPQVQGVIKFIHDNCLSIHLEELKEICLTRLASSGQAADMSIGKIKLDDFVRMTNESRSEYVQTLVSEFDSTDFSLKRDIQINQLRDLLERTSISIEMLSRRINMYETRSSAVYVPTTIFSAVYHSIAGLDEKLFNDVESRTFMKNIGLDLSMCARKFKNCEPSIKKLKTARYNNTKYMLLLFCKGDLEKLRTLLMGKLSEFTSGVSRPRMYF